MSKQYKHSGWIGVDLDGCLAYDEHKNSNHIGEPIPRMLGRVKYWIALGYEVRIVTARYSSSYEMEPVQAWLDKHGIGELEITNVKDYGMIELWDDRAIQVVPNTGLTIQEYLRERKENDPYSSQDNDKYGETEDKW